MFDEEESKSPLNPQQWYEATNAKNALHQNRMEESREDQIHRHTLLLKIDSLRKIMRDHSYTDDASSKLPFLDQFISLIDSGQQPRKRTLKILNKWWRHFNNI